MAITAVAATKIQSGTASASAPVSATAGNSLIVAGSMWSSGSWSVTRPGDTYTTDTNGGSTPGVGVASAPNVVGGSVSCTISCSGAAGITGYAVEVGGLPSSAIRDATSPAVATGVSATATTNSLTNVTADAIYFAVVGDNDPANPTTFTPSGSWSDVIGGTTMKETNNASLQAVDVVFQIVSTTAARTSSWTVTSSNWTCGIAVYKAAASAAVTPPAGPWPRLMPLLAGPI